MRYGGVKIGVVYECGQCYVHVEKVLHRLMHEGLTLFSLGGGGALCARPDFLRI